MTDQSKDIEAAALLLADQLLGGPEGLFAQGVTIRLIGVGVSRLAEKEKTMHQMDLFEWAERNEEEESRRAEAEKAQRAEQAAREKARKAAQAKKARQDKLDAMIEAFEKGYAEAEKQWGGKLPELAQRTREATLLALSVLGGSPGGLLGMLIFHHKIRMAKFRFGLPLILVLQIGFIVLLRSVMVSIVFL